MFSRNGVAAALVAVTVVGSTAALAPASAAASGARAARCTIVGTPGPDVLRGTAADDVICGLRGDDRVFGLGGRDTLFGGPGRDLLLGGEGSDTLRGGTGRDELVGGDGRDTLLGGSGDDRLRAGRGDDVLRGGDGNDRLAGRRGDDMLYGDAGDDTLRGGLGRDRLVGGPGRDLLSGGPQVDYIDARDPADVADHLSCDSGDTIVTDKGDDALRACGVTSPHHAPTALALTAASAAENLPAGTLVGGLVATDADRDERHMFALVPGAGAEDNDAFRVAGSSVLTTRPLDHETEPTLHLRVRATDPTGLSVEQALTVAVVDADDAARPVDDTATVAEDSAPTVIDVLDNDVDQDGDPFGVVGVTQPDGGTVVVSGDGTGVSYQPDRDRCTPTGTTDRFTYTVAGGASATVAVTVACAPDAPTMTASAGTTTYVEQADPTAVDAELGLADPDPGAAISRATVTLTEGRAAEEDVLALDGSHPGIEATSSGATLTLSGTADIAAYRAALRQVTFSDESDNPTTGQRTLVFEVTGDDGMTATATKLLVVTAVNDAPVLIVPGSQVVDEGSVLAFAGAGAVSVTDDDAAGRDIRVSLTATHGTLSLGTTAGLTFLIGDGASDATMSFEGTLDAVGSALAGLTYTPEAGFRGAASVAVLVDDLGASGGPARSATATVAVQVRGLNGTPVNHLPAAQSTAEDTALVLSTVGGNALEVTDPDAGDTPVEVTLASAHGALRLSTVDGLEVVAGADGSPRLTVRGPLADLNAALDGMRYVPDADFHGDDVVEVTTDDLGHSGQGGALRDHDELSVTVSSVNDAPVLVAPAAATMAEDGAVAFTPANDNPIEVADVDSGLDDIVVDLNATHGTVTIGFPFAVSVVGDGTDHVQITGTRQAVGQALLGTAFHAQADYVGAAQLVVDVSDQGHSGVGGALTDRAVIALEVTAVNDAPALHAPTTARVSRGGVLSFTQEAVTMTDVDAAGGDVRIALAVEHGTLTLGGTVGLTFTTGDGTDDAGVSATGTLTAVNAALAGLAYRPATEWQGLDALTLDVSDLGNTGTGGARTASAQVAIEVVDLNTAPVNTVPGPQTTIEDTPLELTGDTRLSVSDVDVDLALGTLQVELSADHGRLTLAHTTGLTFSVGDGTADTRMSLTGSPDRINAALDGLVLTPDADYAGADVLTLTTDDLGASGAPGALSDTDSVALTVTPVNDAPVLARPDATALTYTEDDPAEDHFLAVAPDLTVTDVDDSALAGATVAIAAPVAGDELSFVNQLGITGSFDTAAGTLTLSGAASPAAYQTALRTVAYRTTSENPGATPRTITYRVSDGHASHGLSDAWTSIIDVVPTNDAPVADDEAFDSSRRAIGNTALVVDDPSDAAPDPAGPQKTVTGDLLDGDVDAESTAALTVVPAVDLVTAAGGSVTLQADGDFTYLPPHGCATASDSFDYTVTDNDPAGPRTDTGKVTIAVADCVWYVDPSASAQPAATGGTSWAPYNSLAPLNGAQGTGDADASGDRVFLYDGVLSGGLTLEAGQQLLSQRHGLRVPRGDGSTVELLASAPNDPVTRISDGVVLGVGNVIQGVDFGTTAGGFALSGASVGSLTLNTVTSGGISNTAGGAVSITGAGNVLDVRLSTLAANGGTNGLVLTNTSGAFVATSGSLANATGTEVVLNGGTADVSLTANVSKEAGQLVSVTNASGGVKTFAGSVTDGVPDNNGGGIVLTNNTGATIRFDGAVNLSTGATPALSASGGGTLAVTGTGNSLDTTTGTPLSVINTAIHSDGLHFAHIGSTGAPNGIALVSTGNAGGLTVTGTTGACTAAIPICTGGTIQASTGAGIRAEGVGGGISLGRMRITGGQGDGIRFAESSGLTVDSSLITGNGDATQSGVTAADRDRGVDIENGTGHVAITASQVSGSYYDNVRVDNDSATLDLDLTGSTIAGAKNGDGVQVYGDGNSAIKADVLTNTFTGNFDDALQLVTTGGSSSPSLDLNLDNNQVSANASQVSAGALVTISPGGASRTRVAMSGNTLDTSKGSALILNPAGTSQFDATVQGNTIRNAGGIGVWGKPAQQASSRMRIANNTILGYAGQGMYLRHGEGIGGTASYLVQGNTLSSNVGQEGIFVESGTTSSGSESVSVCADLTGNDLTGTANTGFDSVAFSRYTNSQLTLPSYPGGSDPTSYVQGRNTGAQTVSNWGPQDPTGGPACQAPTLPPAP